MTAALAGDDAAALVDRLRAGETLALSRVITALENDLPQAGALVRALQPHLGHSRVVGITGPPGVGKSTLVNAYIGQLRGQQRSVGVVAVDPSSPISGGAILGDRVRMTGQGLDPEVFIRSLAARGHLGGLAPMAARVVDALDAAGKDLVILETVGTGQSEVEVAQVADVKVVVLAPGLGDEMQALKAGILEIADILVINKADRPLAQNAAAQLKAMTALRARRAPVPVLLTTATTGEGVAVLAEEIDRRCPSGDPAERAARRRLRTRHLLATVLTELIRRDLLGRQEAELDRLCAQVETGELGLEDAALQLLAQVRGA